MVKVFVNCEFDVLVVGVEVLKNVVLFSSLLAFDETAINLVIAES